MECSLSEFPRSETRVDRLGRSRKEKGEIVFHGLANYCPSRKTLIGSCSHFWVNGVGPSYSKTSLMLSITSSNTGFLDISLWRDSNKSLSSNLLDFQQRPWSIRKWLWIEKLVRIPIGCGRKPLKAKVVIFSDILYCSLLCSLYKIHNSFMVFLRNNLDSYLGKVVFRSPTIICFWFFRWSPC
mgnify:CR=1 FL=1